MKSGKHSIGPVVSASHLAEGAMPSLSEMEFALTVAGNAFQRWIIRCMAAAGAPGLQSTDVLILHAANHRSREKTLADIAVMFNIEDTHVVTYAVKKLQSLGLVESGRRGKEKTIRVTDEGERICRRYHEVREALLVSAVTSLALDEDAVSQFAALMRLLSGQYDQAARSAVSL
jgi:predicted MarR family transcription regulator